MSEEKDNHILLVEGQDDMRVVTALCMKHSVLETFTIVDSKGIDKLLESIPVRLKQRGIQTIGIMVDADLDLDKRWKSLRRIFQSEQGYSAPETISEGGWISDSESNGIRIGVWIMPNNQTPGILEDFMAFLVPQGDQAMACVEEHLANLEGKKLQGYKSVARSKAKIHSWLAIQERPGVPLGSAITEKYLDPKNATIAQTFVDWLQKLFPKE